MSITTKEELELLLAVSFDEPLNIDVAYKAYHNYNVLIHNADNETIDYLWRMVRADRKALLKVRTSFAEKGFELTPDQCEQYIFILATSLVDSIGEINKPKT
jgi:hypothetical protein